VATTLTYFSLLGLSEDAGPEELEARYQALADYLASPGIPASLREWASAQSALAEEAYAVLADPERRAAARRDQQLLSETPRAAPAEAEQRQPGRQPEAPDDGGREQRRSAGQAGPAGPGLFGLILNLRSHSLVLGTLVGVAVLAGILLGRYGLPGGGDGGEGVPSTAQDSIVSLDTERVAELTAIVQQDPNNKDALFELGERFFEAGEWQTSIDWLSRLILVDPGNLFAMTDIGTANFNLGQPDVAKTSWLKVLEIDPNYVQAHYNLGFLYANVEPQDLDAARREWETVVQLAPGSDLASTAQVHLSGLLAQTPADAVAGITPSP
jgi:tetratricopeptide (TPR) repeat protein